MGAEPLTPSKKGRGIFGSLEKGIDQVRLLLTPNKKKNKDSGKIFPPFAFINCGKLRAKKNKGGLKRVATDKTGTKTGPEDDPRSCFKNGRTEQG